jgi:hypothetical protein
MGSTRLAYSAERGPRDTQYTQYLYRLCRSVSIPDSSTTHLAMKDPLELHPEFEHEVADRSYALLPDWDETHS